MLNLLQKKTISFDLEETFTRLTRMYNTSSIEADRKEYLSGVINKFGYLPYPQYKALEELSDSEVIFCLIKILENEGTFKNFKLESFKNPSVLSRYKIKNSDWFKKEGHNIKLMSLSALGNNPDETASFINWLCELICLPRGNKELGVLADTIYLLPFHPREFGCAYLPMSSDISPKLEDKKLAKFLGLNGKAQVQLFISLAQLSGHPVIYDILPQTARYSKTVLANPYVARWTNINDLIEKYINAIIKVSDGIKLSGKFDSDLVEETKSKYIETLMGSDINYSEEEKEILEEFDFYMTDIKINFSNKVSTKKVQEELVSRVISIIENTNRKKIEKEEDIIYQTEIIQELISQGFWPMPGGAWCSASVPVFDKMNPTKEYPIYRHYNYKGEDVSKFANLDCQTPYYFVYLENGEYNKKVVDFYVKYTENLQKEYNFDGFRVDHIDHIVDDLSEQNGCPISYRIPRKVLGKVNSNLKKNVPYFATLAEYMLWDNYYKEYNKDMNFDLLWGNDIISQSAKTPNKIIKDNKTLEDYNLKTGKMSGLSILKTYNNQDGEFEAIDRYPGQLGENGALFKWFKYKFLPGGSFANRPSLYVDGDESFTKTGIERVIGSEVSMIRNNNWNFYEKFNAINYFVQNCPIIINGKAKILIEEENGLSAWEINSNQGSLLVIANYKNPEEKIQKEDGVSEIVYGAPIYNSLIEFKGRKLETYFDFCYDEFQKCVFGQNQLNELIEDKITMGVLNPGEFKVFKYEK